MRSIKKHYKLLAVAAVIIFFFVYTTAATKLTIVGRGGYGSLVNERQVGPGEMLYGMEEFSASGIAPIYIEEIKVMDEEGEDAPLESRIFYCDRQNCKMSGGMMARSEFDALYGENLAPLDAIKWMEGKNFDVAVVSEENRIDKTWIEVSYRVWGVFKKKAVSWEIIV